MGIQSPMRRLRDGGSKSLGVGAVLAIIAGVLLLMGLLLVLLRRASRWWRHRLRSAKVLDEIEMEFVNDDDGEFLRSTDTTNLNLVQPARAKVRTDLHNAGE